MRDLARAGVIFRMLPFMAHAKAVVVDDEPGAVRLDQSRHAQPAAEPRGGGGVLRPRSEIDWLAQWIETTASAGETYRARRPGLVRDVAEGLLLTIAFQL